MESVSGAPRTSWVFCLCFARASTHTHAHTHTHTRSVLLPAPRDVVVDGERARGEKRQRSVVKKDMEEPPQAAPVECAGSKKRKKGKRTVRNRDDITIFPRRKAGQDKLGSNRPPIVISRSVLESYFNMPQQKVCEKLVSGEPEQRFWEALSCACACA